MGDKDNIKVIFKEWVLNMWIGITWIIRQTRNGEMRTRYGIPEVCKTKTIILTISATNSES